jgi:hypothetical protein
VHARDSHSRKLIAVRWAGAALCRNVPEYSSASHRLNATGFPLWTPAVKFGWADDDGSGKQVFGKFVNTTRGMKRRRKFGRILSLRENGLITGFNTLPNHVQRDMLYKEVFDQKYFEPTLEARPFMASFDTNQIVNQGQVFRVVRLLTSRVVDSTKIDTSWMLASVTDCIAVPELRLLIYYSVTVNYAAQKICYGRLQSFYGENYRAVVVRRAGGPHSVSVGPPLAPENITCFGACSYSAHL